MDSENNIDQKSVRAFGFIWCIILGSIWGYQYIYYENQSDWLIYTALAILSITILYPKLFVITKIYSLWIKFGNIVGKINSIIILSALFFAIFTPIALLFRILRRDILGKKLDQKSASYFITRTVQPTEMKNQF